MINKTDFTFPSIDGLHQVHAVRWEADDVPKKGIVQLTHGMCEYIGRYTDFAEFLCRNGYIVTGHDHLGHGQTAVNPDELGYFGESDGFMLLVEDVDGLRKLTQEKYPDLPYHLLGHSMGSFVSRIYITKHAEGLASATLVGTGNTPQFVVDIGRKLIGSEIEKHGRRYRSEKVNNMAFGSYGKEFVNEGVENAWLSRDRAIVDKYNADPFTQFMFTAGAYDDMFLGLVYLNNMDNIKKMPRDLPVLITAGDRDPVGNFGKAVKGLYETFKEIGMKNVELKLYHEGRHEILNEINRAEVYDDMLAWFDKNNK